MNEIKQLLQHSTDWLSLIEELEAQAEQIDDRAEKSRRLYVLGQACEELFLRKDKAMVNYQKAFKLLPHDARPLVRARQIYREMGNLKMVARLMDFQLKVVSEPRERALLLIDLALVHVDLCQPDEARKRLSEARAADLSAPGLDGAFAVVTYDRGDWQGEVGRLVDAAEALAVGGAAANLSPSEAETAAAMLVRAARVQALEAPDDPVMAEDLLRRAVEIDPQNEVANFQLELLLDRIGRRHEIREIHEKRLALVSEEERATFYRYFASIWAVRFGELDVTAQYYDLALRSFYSDAADPFPGHLAAFNLLCEVQGADESWEGLVELADKGLHAPLLEHDLAVLAVRAGNIVWRQLSDAPRAASYFDWVQKIDPENPALTEFLQQNPDALKGLEQAEADEAEATRAEPEVESEPSVPDEAEPAEAPDSPQAEQMEPEAVQAESEEAPVESKRKRRKKKNKGQAAVEAASEQPVEQHDAAPEPQQEVPPAADEPQQESEGDRTPTQDTLVTVAPDSPVDDSETAPSESSDLETRLEAEPAAEPTPQELSEQVVGADPVVVPEEVEEEVEEEAAAAFAEARAAEEEAAERGINAWRKVAQKWRQYRTPRRALARLYAGAERWNQLVEVLKEEVDLVEDPRQKRAMLRQMAEVYRDRLRLDAMVANALGQALKTYDLPGGDTSQPAERLQLVDLLVEQYERMKRWTDLINTLRKKSDIVDSVSEKVAIWTQIANLFFERFSNQAEAIKAYEEVLELDSTNVEALSHLKEMYEKRRDWDKLIGVWKKQIDGLSSDAERAAAYLEVAQLASTKLRRPQVSMELWGEVLKYDSSNVDALGQLELLYEKAKEWEKLSDICQRQVELIDDAARKTQLLQKLGLLYSDKIDDEQGAIAAWQQLLELDPDNRRAQDSLKKLYLAAKAYDQLEAFYARQDKWDEFIRVLERQVESEAADGRLPLYFKIADLWQQKLNKPDRAVRAYEKVLAVDENNEVAAEALIPLYQGGRDVRKYARVLEIQLSHTGDESLKLERIRALAELCEGDLRDADAAFAWMLRAFEVDPKADWIREQTERLAAETGKWLDVVSAYEAAYERLVDPLEQLPILLTVARVYEQELGNAEEALRANKRVLEIEPQHPQALDALERLYARVAQWSDLLDVYQRKIELVDDPEERKEIYFRTAHIYEEEVGDAERAISAYRTILDLAGDDSRALRRLNSIYQQQERWGDLAETLLRELTLVPPSDADTTIDLKFRLGKLQESQLDDVASAIECYRDILELQPTHEGAREALELRLASPDHQVEVVRILEPIYSELEQWSRLVEVNEIRLARERDPASQVDLLLRIGALWVDRLGHGEKAFDAYSRCFKVDPSNEPARAELERLAEIQDRLEDLAGLYEQATNQALEAPLQHELLIRLAGIMDDRLEDAERAIEFYKRAQDIEPDDLKTLDALEKLFTRREQWNDLLGVYSRKTDLSADAEERQRLFARMATIWEEMLGELGEAISCYNEILAVDDTNLEALRALDRLYQVQGSWHELADNLTRQLTVAETDHEAIDLLVRLASVRETELGETAAAVDTYRQVLERDSRNESAVSALERLIVNEEHQLAIAQILDPYYKSAADWSKLVQVYEIMVNHAYDPDRKLDLLHEIAELHEVAGEDSTGAFAVYGRALRETPGHEATQNSLERLARQLGNWQDLVDLYGGLVADLMDEALAVSLHTKIATIYERQLENLDQAAAAHRRILEIDPQSIEAVNALEQIYTRAESYERLVDTLLKKTEIVLDGLERKNLLFRAAQIQEEVLERPEDAIGVYQRVLEVDAGDPQAIEALERLYFRLERWEDLKDNYTRKVELTDSAEEKKQIFYRLGSLYQEQLEDVDRAIDTFQAVLDLDPEDVPAVRALGQLFQQAERWYDLLQVLERQVELAGASTHAVDLKHRMGRLWERELGETTRAVETYREVLMVDAVHQPTLEALDSIVHGEAEPVAAAQVLEPVYEQSLEWARLIDLYEVMVRHVDDPFRTIELLHKIAELREYKLDDSAGAFDAYGRALQEESSDEVALAALERLAPEINGWEPLTRLYEAELDKLLDPIRQTEMGLRVARIYEEELGQAGRAIEHYNRVIDADPENGNAILALDRLYMDSGQYERLADILRREIRMAETEQDIIDLQFRLGQLYQEDLKDLGNAIECYREILASTPEHTPSLTALELLFEDGQLQLEIAETLEPLYRMSEQWPKLVKIMEVQLEQMDDELDKVQAVQRIAEICEQRLADHQRAFQWYGYALRFDPVAEALTEELERLARLLDGWEDLAVYYGGVLEPLDAEDRRSVLRLMARVYDEELRDPGRAEQAYLGVLEIEPEDTGALSALDRLYDEAEMHRELADILRRRIAVTDETDALVELQLRMGMTLETSLNDLTAAEQAYSAVLEADSRNTRALEALERIYYQGEQWPRLYEVYEKMIDIAPGDSGVADCYARMGKIASDALEDPERAQDLWSRVLDLRGEDPTALWALADLYESANEWSDLVEVLERQARIVEEPQDQVALFQRLGRIWGENLQRDRNSLEAWQKVIEIEPNNLTALRAIAQIYRNTQAWEELAETLRRLVDIGITLDMSNEEIKSLYTQLGELLGDMLLRPQEAIEAWRRVLDLQADDFAALAALEQLLTQEARWEECIQVLERKAQVLEGAEEKIDVLVQGATIWQEKVGNDRAAARLYEQVMGLDRAHDLAFNTLEQIYAEGENWEQLVELLLARVDLVEEVDQSVALLHRVAKIYEEHLGQPEAAFMVLQASFKRDYGNDVTVKELERLASITNSWNDLLTECSEIVQTVQDPKTKADLLVNMGIWYAELGHLDYAVPSVQQALQIDPQSKRALDALASFFRKTGQWTDLVQVLNRSQELEDDTQKRVGILCAMGEVLEDQVSDHAQATTAYRRAQQLDESNAEVLDALERLYRNTQSWDGLVEVLGRKAELADDPDVVMSLRARIGELHENETQDPSRAIESYKDVLVMDPQNLPALRALERLYERTGRTEDYVDVLEQQLDVAGTDEERVALYQRMASVWEEQFGKLDRAAECLEKVLLIDERNLVTYTALERLYEAEGRFEDLVDVYRRHINVVADPDRVQMYLAMGRVCEESLRDPDRAIEAYSDILSFEADQTEALDALARLYEQIESWDRAIDVMSQLVQLMDDPGYRVNVLHRMGLIYESRMEDAATAEERFTEALEIESAHAPAMLRLVEIYRQRGDWAKAAKMMVRAEEYTANALEKTRLLYEAGDVYLNQMGDEATATELFGRTLAIDPDHVEAGEPLAAVYFREGRYEEVEPVLEMLVRKTDKRNNKRLQELYYQLGKTTDVLEKSDKALKYYRSAYDIDSTDLPTLRGMADLLHRTEDWDRAFKIYQTILVHHRDDQAPQEIVDIFYRLGNIKLKLGERKKALNMFEKAQELDPHHRATLEAVIDLRSKQGEWDAVIEAKRALMERAEGSERFDLLVDVGGIYQEKLSNSDKAIQAFSEARELQPNSHPLIHRLIELYSSTKQWKRAVEMVLVLAEMETNPRLRARYLYTAGVIHRDEIRSLDEAAELFDRTLDETFGGIDASSELEPDQFKAFEALDRICTQKKDWKAQERYYRKMIKRLPADGQSEWKVRLWHALGEIYRTRLRDYKGAMASFEVATQLDPGNLQRHEILAELYMLAGPDMHDKAIKQHQVLINASPYKIESYKALRQIYMDTKQYDKAWCVCATLFFLKKADSEEQRFYEQYRQRGFVRARARMTDDLWRKQVFHSDEDLYIGTILGTIAPTIGDLMARPHKAYGLKKKERRDLANDTLMFSKVFNYVTSLLAVTQADLFLSDRATGMQMAHTVEKPSFVVGHDLLQGRPEKELAFLIGKQLTYLRPEHFLRNVLQASPAYLRTVFLAALRLCNPQFPVPPAEQDEVNRFFGMMHKRVHPAQLEQLAGVVQRFVQRTSEVNLGRWLAAVELTANRVGFICTNDLDVAAKMVSTEASTVGSLPPKDRVKELVLYSVSEEYFGAREELGLTIGT